MVSLLCDPANLTVVADVAHCSQWVAQPAGFWDSMSNQDFQELLAACIKFGFAAFLVWWLVWAARRF